MQIPGKYQHTLLMPPEIFFGIYQEGFCNITKKHMQSTGYSGTPLAKKLGIKEGFIIRLINEPANYFTLFTDLPHDVNFTNDKKILKNCIHYFTKELKELDKEISGLRNEILPDGMIWISWPKKLSKVKTNITENDIRNIALANGLVDIKVCAIDETWSGLKLVIPLKDRKNK